MNFPLRTAFAESHRFCKVVFSLSFVVCLEVFSDFLFDFIIDPLTKITFEEDPYPLQHSQMAFYIFSKNVFTFMKFMQVLGLWI